MRDSSNRDAKSLRAKRLEAEQGYLVLLFFCLLFVEYLISLTRICSSCSSYLASRLLESAFPALRIPHPVYAHLLFLLFVSRISFTRICLSRSSYPASRLLESAFPALRISHLVHTHLPFPLFVSRIPFTRICPSSSSYLASRLRASALLLFLIARYKKGRS